MFSLTKGALLALGLSAAAHSRVKILADTNRDGTVDDADEAGKKNWTPDRGALFMANIGDSNGLGKEIYAMISTENDPTTGGPWTERRKHELLSGSNDGSDDDVLYNAKYAAPLHVTITGDVSEGATGTVTLSGTSDETLQLTKANVRIWHKYGPHTNLLPNYKTHHIKDSDMKSGKIELAIDSRDVRRPNWDGIVTVTFTLEDGGKQFQDSVQLRVAPVLIDHVLQKPETIFTAVTEEYSSQKKTQDAFVNEIKQCPKEPGLDGYEEFTRNNPFIRDSFVSGYTSIPGPGGEPKVLRLLVKSSRTTRSEDAQVHEIKSDSLGVVRLGGSKEANCEGLGNLLIIPPYTKGADSYPHGRALMGMTLGGTDTQMMRFIASQGVQTPMHPPSNKWLWVGHMDEYIAILPCRAAACEARGWTLAVADAEAGWDIIQRAAQKSPNTVAWSRAAKAWDSIRPEGRAQTLKEIVQLDQFDEATRYAARKIAPILKAIMGEIGIEEKEIIRVPTVFYYAGYYFHKKDDIPHKEPPVIEGVTAMYPNAVNGVSYKDELFMTGDPFGPVIDGQDVLKLATTKAFKDAGYDVRYIDTAQNLHDSMGDLHCGTNEMRRPNGAWWKNEPVTWPKSVKTT